MGSHSGGLNTPQLKKSITTLLFKENLSRIHCADNSSHLDLLYTISVQYKIISILTIKTHISPKPRTISAQPSPSWLRLVTYIANPFHLNSFRFSLKMSLKLIHFSLYHTNLSIKGYPKGQTTLGTFRHLFLPSQDTSTSAQRLFWLSFQGERAQRTARSPLNSSHITLKFWKKN